MTLSAQYQKISYLEALRDLLSALYGVDDEKSDKYKDLKNRLDGFVHAGLHIRLVTKSELQEVVDSEHLAAFGMTRKQRSVAKKLSGNVPKSDWSAYDTPAIGRK